MSEKDISHVNSEKLDRIILAVEGTKDFPGISGRLAATELILYGEKGKLGLVQQHAILWRAHTWILMVLSAGASTIATLLIERFVKGHP